MKENFKILKEEIINNFIEYSSIPHPSHHTEKMLIFLENFASQRGYQTYRNNSNLVIEIPSSLSYVENPPIILQAHMDMVAVKENDSQHDFLRHPIEIIIDEDQKTLTANKTTLGADDGIGIVYMMMIMQNPDFNHPKLYLVITSDEEVGLIGARKLDPNIIKDAKYMINLDTEAEGYLSIASSGGEALVATYNVEQSQALGDVWELSISGLTGGHSGGAINNNGLHAAKGLAQILGHLFHIAHIRLVEFDAKGADNVITDSAKATFITGVDKKVIADNTVSMSRFIATAYHETDPNIKIDLKLQKSPNKLLAYTPQSTANIIFNVLYAPYGVVTKSNGNVTCSCNIGNCYTRNDLFTLRIHTRFKQETFKELIKNKILQYYTFTHAFFESTDYSPAWKKTEDNNLVDKVQEIWSQLYDTPLIPVEGHGILECGMFQEKMPDLKIISIGPTVTEIHTPNETLDLDSAVRVYLFLIELLEKLEEGNKDL